MRRSIILLLLCLSFKLPGATYYVSTTGNDSNPGTIGSPWATWQKGFNSISPGDILYIRGGTYTPTVSTSHSRYCAVVIDSKKGTSGNLYNVWAYPGETPILDCRNITGTSYERYGILLYNASYWYLKGLTITRVDQLSTGNRYGGQGILVQGDDAATNNTIENCVAHHNGGPGMGTRMYVNETHFINCDSYSNWDPYSDIPGDNADGFDCGYSRGDAIVRFTGCRSWSNGDDGYDLLQGDPTPTPYIGTYYITNCWAWENGYYPDGVTKGGNGCGFKYGPDRRTTTTTKRFTYNCISYANRSRGYSQESDGGTNPMVKKEFYNNISYNNGIWGWSFYQTEVPDIVRNNIAFGDGVEDIHYGNGTRVTDHNSWDSGSPVVSTGDFVSVDGTELLLPRKADGSLPDINFLRLAAGSDLIDAGVNVGNPYTGNGPDLGAFEMQTGTAIIVPVFISSAVENLKPGILEMIYNTALAIIVPAASSFSVSVNSAARTVNSVAISGTKVLLTLATPIVYGDVVTIIYTKPSANTLQTVSGGQAVTISAQPVTNKVNSVIPVYVSSAVQNATPSLLEITYNLTLANISPAASAFSVRVNSTARTVNTVTISGTKVQLTLATPIVSGDVVTVAYTKPATNPVQTASGGQTITIAAQTVTNNLTSPSPVYQNSAVANATPSILEMTYSLTLANVIPASSAFAVRVNSVNRAVNTVAISGKKVLLTLASPIVFGNVVTISYTKPSTNPLQVSSVGIAANISNQPVTNNCINAAPTAVIISPGNNSSFTAPANITITANASDANGSISKVEFYNGNTKIGEKAAAPFSITWNSVALGNYSLTAVATDNLNAKTTSSAISISVNNGTPIANQRPLVKISNPGKGVKFVDPATIIFDAVASDLDGTISKVEFYNGSVKLVELTSPPYSYTWKDVAVGTYSIIAIATDNLNSTTTSSPIEFSVEAGSRYDGNSEIVNLYPNPSDGHFSIELFNPLQNEKSEIIISDLGGKQVYHGPLLKEETTKEFDLSSLKSGIYVMMIIDKEIFVTKKFIKF